MDRIERFLIWAIGLGAAHNVIILLARYRLLLVQKGQPGFPFFFMEMHRSKVCEYFRESGRYYRDCNWWMNLNELRPFDKQ